MMAATTNAEASVLSVVYTSTAVVPFSRDDLFELLEHSRENNARDGLTGMLLYRGGRFLQVLEGPEDAVRTRIEAIRADERHERFGVLIEETADERHFPDWTMGFASDAASEGVPGYLTTFAGIDADDARAGADGAGADGPSPEAEAALRQLLGFFEDPANHVQ
ncbi:BLUF domain-containing protein [Herbiconiux sp. KACC 21604]|uniref:BLUF domain-containing protein n=1 Tax=unclassified Herbiconiux TaxID=2618217 RepID=UPI0014917CD5|nr:BLUF domain-containing protein [Herbiconiux sp. SALV-R1]QJU55761.1 BLUF domain-containing protein [Herbiconiux sp. SALV-R1]WPO86969.1 BLUF domain-containing protein [Herbiconiux sp. KACC 21604]